MKLVLKQPFYNVFPLCCVNHTSDLQGIPSCNGAMESPKLGLRFSWKGSAKDQVQEWHPLKVVIEFSTARNSSDDVIDPVSENSVPFDHQMLGRVKEKERP